jgi:hypothetical protein
MVEKSFKSGSKSFVNIFRIYGYLNIYYFLIKCPKRGFEIHLLNVCKIIVHKIDQQATQADVHNTTTNTTRQEILFPENNTKKFVLP